MAKFRIIPRLNIKGQSVVKGINNEGLKVVGDPKILAMRYFRQGADEILYTDIVASLYQRSFDFDLLRSVAKDIFVPITVGGGVRSVNDVNNALRSGADKVLINTYAIKNPNVINQTTKHFGSQCIVVAIDAKKIAPQKWEVYTDGGREKTGKDVLLWVKEAVSRGAGEIIVSSIDMDGTKKGFDLELVESVCAICKVPVIIGGGAGNLQTFKSLLKSKKLPNALSASSIFHHGGPSIMEVKKLLTKEGHEVRL